MHVDSDCIATILIRGAKRKAKAQIVSTDPSNAEGSVSPENSIHSEKMAAQDTEK